MLYSNWFTITDCHHLSLIVIWVIPQQSFLSCLLFLVWCSILSGYSIEHLEIELNRTQSMDWVRLSSAIQRNQTWNFVWETEPNRTQSIGLCAIEFGNQTQSNTIQWIEFGWVRMSNFLCEFDFVRLPNAIELNPWIGLCWVDRVQFTVPGI